MTEKYDNVESVQVLYEISGLIHSNKKLEDKFAKALEMIKNAVSCDSASLFIYNAKQNTLEEAATVGTKVDLIESTEFEMGTGLSAWVAKQRDSVLLPSVRKDRHDGFRSFISTPLVSMDKLVGVLNVGHKHPGFFTEKHQRFLEIIAGELANSIERVRFENELKGGNDALVMAGKEIEKQQKQLVEMEKYQVLAQIVASINHEINNPLTTIIGTIELLLMKHDEIDQELVKKLNIVLDESKRIRDIIKKLRDVKQIAIKDYVKSETMIDVDYSANGHEGENLS